MEQNNNIFKHIETCTQQEKQAIATEVMGLYKESLLDEQECFGRAVSNRKSMKLKREYMKAVQRLGAIQDVFDLLHISYSTD